jgi:hypothetical protein
MTPSSRHCRRFMMVPSWSLRGLCIFQTSDGSKGRNSLHSPPQALPRPTGCAGRRTAPQRSSAERRQTASSRPSTVVRFTPAILLFRQGLSVNSETAPTCFILPPTGHFRFAATPASAASAARQRRPPAPLNSQTGALHRLRTNIPPSCKNADVESPTLK